MKTFLEGYFLAAHTVLAVVLYFLGGAEEGLVLLQHLDWPTVLGYGAISLFFKVDAPIAIFGIVAVLGGFQWWLIGRLISLAFKK